MIIIKPLILVEAQTWIMFESIKPNIMKLILSLIFSLSLVGSSYISAQTVFITKTGSKYHTSSCRYLHSSKIETDCSDLSSKYSACSVCDPSCSTSSTSSSSSSTSSSSTSSSTSTATQCSASTQAGNRCKRKTTNSSGKCWQHD